MSASVATDEPDVVYPDSDGQPMAENTLQFQWIVTIKENLEILFQGRPDVFVAGDNLIYPVKGDRTVRQAPDVYVAVGRPKGHRGSYRVWEEAGIFPQVVFEILSPGNRAGEMKKKRDFYRRYGAEEYYVYDPDDNVLEGWTRDGDTFREIPVLDGFVSPRLGITFATTGAELVVYHPNGRRFLTVLELSHQAAQARHQAEQAQHQAAQAQHQAAQAQHQAEQAREENDRLRAMLRAAGIDPGQAPAG